MSKPMPVDDVQRAEDEALATSSRPVVNPHVSALIAELVRLRPDVLEGTMTENEIARDYCAAHPDCENTPQTLLVMARKRRDLLPPLPVNWGRRRTSK